MKKLTETSSEEAAARLGAKAVGEVAYVDGVDEFVHLRLLTGMSLPADTTLETRSSGKRTSLLRTTAERNKFFTVADLLEGLPSKGESAFPSTAKAKPTPPRKPAPGVPAGITGDNAPAVPPVVSAPEYPALPMEAPDPSAPVFDPTNLPPLADPVKTPEDIKR